MSIVIDMNGIKASEIPAAMQALADVLDPVKFAPWLARTVRALPDGWGNPLKESTYHELGVANYGEVLRAYLIAFRDALRRPDEASPTGGGR